MARRRPTQRADPDLGDDKAHVFAKREVPDIQKGTSVVAWLCGLHSMLHEALADEPPKIAISQPGLPKAGNFDSKIPRVMAQIGRVF
jgi:hypothetical protein